MIFVRPRNSWLWIGTSLVAVLLIIAIAPPPHLSGTPSAPSPIPFLQAISPVSALPGGTAFVLTVTGTNFAANSIVEWGTTQLATTFVSPVKLTAVVPAPVIATRGAGWITVVTPAPGGGTSNTLFLPVTVTVSTLTFGESTTPGTDSDWSVVEGDFNNDGNLDVVSANRASNSLTVFLGNGNGTFQAGQTIALSTSPFGLVAGDLNHDGNLDLIFSPINATSGGIAVLLGNGDGSFQAPSIIAPFGSDVDSCLTLALADLDGDGNLDLVAGITRREGIQVFLGNGDGTFQAPDNYGLELGPIDQVKIGDLNGDGKLDLITTNESEISILLGNGDGTFQNSLSYPLQTVVSIGVADFDGDGNPDVAAATTNNGLFLLRGNGDGSLQSPQFIGAGVDFGIESGDFDGDGKLDIVTTDGRNNTLDFYLGNGDGTFQSVQSFGSDLFRLWVFPVGNFASDQGLAVVAADSAISLLLFQTALVVSPTIVDFGRVTVGATPGSQSVTLTNGTQANVSIVAVSIAQAGADFQLGSNACIGMLASNASCMIQINFSPSQVGSESATLQVNGSAPNGPRSALLRGVGQLTQPTATLSSNFATFPSDVSGATSPPQLVTLTNTGSVNLPITTISLGGLNPGDFTESNDCGTTLAPNATCTLTMTFSPTTGGLRMATVLLTDGAPDSPQNILLQGVGQDFTVDVTTPVITVAPGSTAQFHLNIGPQGSFSRLITFTCSGAPRNSTCSVAPSSITPTAASTDVVVSFITQAQFLFFTASPAAKPFNSRFLYPIFSVALAFVWYRKGHGRTLKRLAERQLTTARALAVFAGLVILFGCGHTNVPTVRTGAYNLTITATSGSLSHSSVLTVIVQ